MDRIRKEGRYFKCLKTRYRFSDNSILYKNVDLLIKEQIDIILKVVGVEKNISIELL